MTDQLQVAMFHANLPAPGRKPGGVEVFVDRLASALSSRGHSVTIFTYSEHGAERLYKTIALRPRMAVRSRTTRTFILPWRFNFMAFTGFDLLHLHGDDWFFLRRALPTVRTFYGSALLEGLSATSRRRQVNQAILFPLELAAARLATARYGIAGDSRAIYRADGILRCGVDPEWRPVHKTGHPTIAFVGTWAGRKRGSFLARVFQEAILPRVPSAELVMITDYCEAIPSVTWVQNPTDAVVTRILGEAWVFCLPSTYEGLGLPYLESMAVGTPVVASPNPGSEYLLRAGDVGIIADDADLADALVRLLGDADGRRRLIERGRERASEFSWDSIVPEYERAYALAIKRWRAARATAPAH